MIFAFYQFGCHAAGCNGCSAAKGFKFYIADDSVIVNVQINTHDIAAFCIADGSDTACIFDFAYITRMIKMIHNFFAVHKNFLQFSVLFFYLYSGLFSDYFCALYNLILSFTAGLFLILFHEIFIEWRHASQSFDNLFDTVYNDNQCPPW